MSAFTPGPWKVMPCPVNNGLHPCHDHRWIATADAEFGHDCRGWSLSSGSLICEMRDGPIANARLIAACPDMLAACRAALALLKDPDADEFNANQVEAFLSAAITKASP